MRNEVVKKIDQNNPLLKRDCFAFHDGNCAVLTETLCCNGKCGFYKTKAQHRSDLLKYPPINYPEYLKEKGLA